MHTYIYIYTSIYIYTHIYLYISSKATTNPRWGEAGAGGCHGARLLVTDADLVHRWAGGSQKIAPATGGTWPWISWIFLGHMGKAIKRKNMETYENIHVCLAIGKVGEMDEFLSFFIWENMRHDRDFSQRHEAIMIHSAASRTDCLKRHMASVARIKYDQVMGYPLEFLKKWSSTTSG